MTPRYRQTAIRRWTAAIALAADGAIGPKDGAMLLAGLVVHLGVARRQTMSDQRPAGGRCNDGESSGDVEADHGRPSGRQTLLAVVVFAAEAVGVAISAQFVVSGAEQIALSIGVPELVVGLTVLAVDTSAPEIVTSVVAAMRGNTDVAIGNAIGSNVFHLLFVLGLVSVTHSELPVADELIRLDIPVMLLAAVLVATPGFDRIH